MRTLGLIGGMSWESTTTYYQKLNRLVQQKLGGLHSAKILLHSLDFNEIAHLQHQNDWNSLTDKLTDAARKLEGVGADAIVICTNTMHLIADPVQNAVTIPLLHIADGTAEVLKRQQVKTCGLLGTAFTMQKSFYKQRLIDRHAIGTLVPDEPDQAIVHRVIYEELCKGVISASSRKAFVKIIDTLVAKGAQSIVLGCTEIGLLIEPHHVSVPLVDTTDAHARQAVDFALAGYRH